jgi:uroporphyrinogen-III synthase
MSPDSRSNTPLPLAGLQVYSTRTGDAIATMTRGLHEALAIAGAGVIDMPLVKTERCVPEAWTLPPDIWTKRGWVCVTNREAVYTLANALAAAALPMHHVHIAVVGAAAHEAATAQRWPIAVDIPEVAVGVGVHASAVVAAVSDEFLRRDDVAGRPMILLTSEELCEPLMHAMQTLGFVVHATVVNRTVPAPGLSAQLSSLMPAAGDQSRLLLVTSPTAVDILTGAMAPEKTKRFPLICIGRHTARAARTAGFAVTIEMEYVNGAALVRHIISLRTGSAPPSPATRHTR